MEHDDSEIPEALTAKAVAACERVAAKLEFRTFLVGVQSRDASDAFKRELKRQVGLALEALWPERSVAFRRADVVFIYEPERDWVTPTVRSIYLYGRYRKLARDLTQTETHWRCGTCRNRGAKRATCAPCRGTGRRFPDSVEELLAAPFAEAYASREFALHGLGREDVDVQCLGRGRPFVLEFKRPRRRTADLTALRAELNQALAGRVEIAEELQLVDGNLVARLKGWVTDKAYRALCRAERPLEPAALAKLEALSGVTLEQRTPARVSHRRVDKVRRRQVLELSLHAQPDPQTFVLDLVCQSGTYVKEFVSGDEGRTTPSLSATLGVACVCERLDVLDVLVSNEALLGAEPAPLPIQD